MNFMKIMNWLTYQCFLSRDLEIARKRYNVKEGTQIFKVRECISFFPDVKRILNQQNLEPIGCFNITKLLIADLWNDSFYTRSTTLQCYPYSSTVILAAR